MSTKIGRNTTIDSFKAIAALCVVFLHYNHIDGYVGDIYTRIVFYITTFAVPFFFMVTGYFLPQLISKGRQKNYMKKILGMALCSTILYFTYYCIKAPDCLEWIKSHYTLGTITMWFTGQDDPSAFHLWYFYCLLWSFVIVYSIVKLFNTKVLYSISLVLIIYHFIGFGWFDCYTQSIPAMAAGIFMYNNRCVIIELTVKHALFGILCSLLLMACACIYNYNIYQGHMLAFVAFAYATARPYKLKFNKLADIGLRYSAYIYIFHVLINDLLSYIIMYDNILLQIVRPFLVFAVSLLLSVVYVGIKSRVNQNKILWST